MPFLAAAGARIDGLRLLDRTLIAKVEQDGRAVQVRVTNEGLLLAGGGMRLYHDCGLELPMEIARLKDLWSVSGGPAPRCGRVLVGEEREPLIMLAANRAKVTSQREIAMAYWGLEEVAKHWDTADRMRAWVRYRLDVARRIERRRGVDGGPEADGVDHAASRRAGDIA